jgi:cell division protein FtsW (lipid II flippase)
VNQLLLDNRSPRNQIQTRLLVLAVFFVFLGNLILTFAPAVRLHSWQVSYRWEHWIGFTAWLAAYTALFIQVNKFLPDRDPYLLPIFSILNGWGLLMIFRLDPNYGFRQTIWMVIAILGALVALRLPNLLTLLRRYKYFWLIGGILLTLLTFFIGTYPGGDGPGLWLNLGSFYLQPSEVLKFLLVVYLAAYLADIFRSRLGLMQLLAPTLVLIGLAVLILVAQRDLGTASLFIFIYTVVVYLASGKRRILLISFILVVAALIVGYIEFDVIQLRIEAWLNPWLDARDRSYQIVQSLIAVANGGLLGRGVGLGSPGVVPVASSDFIFPAILEEFGIAGGLLLIGIYAVLTVRGIYIALHAPNQFQRLLAAGLTVFIAAQSILIMGGTIRLLPLTGVTLPFISYGGTSLVVSVAAGLLMMIISNQAEDQPATIYRTTPYALVGGVMLVGFSAIALLSAFWGIIRADALLARGDNPRRAISDRYVYRGTILDSNNTPLTASSGIAGEYERVLLYPELSAVVGYSDPNFGQAGIESKLDGILRGITYNNPTEITTTRLLYGQDPEGYDLRLSLNLALQQIANDLLTDYTGAIVVLNASSGEIIVMATSPTFDANQLDENWPAWMADESAPLLNRATQGLYPPGATTSGVLLARFLSDNTLSSSVPGYSWTTTSGSEFFCALNPGRNNTWGELISAGCIKAIATVNHTSTRADTLTLYRESGLFQEQNLPLETSRAIEVEEIPSIESLYSGQAGILVSPLQVAVMASTLSNGGHVVTPQIAMAYKKPEGAWTLIEIDSNPTSLSNFAANNAARELSQGTFQGWEISSIATHEKATIAWYVTGTPPDWLGTPITLVVALEDGSALYARRIGRELFLAATADISE